jgi:hypothetical protein
VAIAVDRGHHGTGRVHREVPEGHDAARQVGPVGDARVDDGHADAVAVFVGHADRRGVVRHDAHGGLERRLEADLFAVHLRVFRDRQHVRVVSEARGLARRHLEREPVDQAVLAFEAGAVPGQELLGEAALARLDSHDHLDQVVGSLAQRLPHLPVHVLRGRRGRQRDGHDEREYQDAGAAQRDAAAVGPDRLGATVPRRLRPVVPCRLRAEDDGVVPADAGSGAHGWVLESLGDGTDLRDLFEQWRCQSP